MHPFRRDPAMEAQGSTDVGVVRLSRPAGKQTPQPWRSAHPGAARNRPSAWNSFCDTAKLWRVNPAFAEQRAVGGVQRPAVFDIAGQSLWRVQSRQQRQAHARWLAPVRRRGRLPPGQNGT